MSSIDRLAQRLVSMHKENVNPPNTSPQVATVIGASPLKLKWGDGIILTDDKLHVPKIFGDGILYKYKTKDRYQDVDGVFHDFEIDQEFVFKITLSVGDNVIIIPDANYKMFFLSDLL